MEGNDANGNAERQTNTLFDRLEEEINNRQTGWIGTVEVNRDTGLEPGETQGQNVYPGTSPASRFPSTVPIPPV